MTNAISGSFDPIAFIQGINSSITAANNANASSQTNSTGSTGSDNNTSSTGGTNSSSTLGLSSALLSILQGDSSSSQNGTNLSTILGDGGSGVSSSDPLAGVYNSLLSNVSSIAPLANAIADTQQQQAETQTQTQTNSVQNLISSYNSAANAYNQTLLQNAQAVAAANDYGPGGTSLIS